jgi:ribonucleoside-diphosphate reductase alpha chain
MTQQRFRPTGISKTIFKDRYAFTAEETWEQACLRVARQMSLAESPDKQRTYEEKFNEVLVSNQFVPGGRIWYNSGRNNPQLLNCFVLGNQLDSKEGWGNLAREMIITSMTGGGCGQDFSDVRPRGARIGDQKGECPGPVELMRLIDSCAKPVRSGGQRRVALMFSLDLDHPDVEEFLDAKLEKGELTHANVSVRVKKAAEFIKAVQNDGDWELSWKGKYKRTIKAKPLWEKIVKNAYNCAEPGLLNWELVESESNIGYIEKLVTTNPSLRKGTKVITVDGIFPIEELENQHIVVKNLNGELSKAECFLSGKDKQLYKITLSTGQEYFCTAEHKWPILTHTGPKKVETTEICVGDRFPTLKQDKLFDGDLGSYEDGFVIGWLYGDGWITERTDDGAIQYGFIFSEDKQKCGIADRVIDYLNKITGKQYIGNLRDGNIELNLRDKRIDDHFKQFGVGHKSKGLPNCVWKNGSEELRKGIIDGLFSSDGHVGTKLLRRIVFTSKHEQLIRDVAELLGFYGIKSRYLFSSTDNVSFPNGKNYEREYERRDLYIDHAVDISHFRKIFKLSNSSKQERLDSYEWTRESGDWVTVTAIELTDIREDVWDISVYDKTHCFQLSHCVTGNCGEIALSSYDCCCLGHLVITRFIQGTEFNWAALADTVRTGVRFLDNVLTVNNYPLPEMKEKSHKLRRIGLGTTGLADALAMLGFRYGSQDGNEFVDKLYKFIAKVSYESSVMLAVEKGAFPACEPEKHIESGFMKRMPHKIRSLVKEHGIRNCALLTQAPTGTVSMLSGNCSSGIEPMFASSYERRFWKDNARQTELVFHPLFAEFMKQGRDVSHFVGSQEISVQQHMEVQAIVQKYVDNAVSKTINMAEDYPIEDMAALWLEYLPKLKGTTFYRANSRGYVREDGTVEPPPLTALSIEEAKARFNETHSVDKERELDCPGGICEL